MPDDFVVTPWEVKGSVDYDRLVTQFGTERITLEILERIRKTSCELLPLFWLCVFYCYCYVYCILYYFVFLSLFFFYSCLCPSCGILIGHMLPWFFTYWLLEK